MLLTIAAVLIIRAIKTDEKADRKAAESAIELEARRILNARKEHNKGQIVTKEFRVAGTSYNQDTLMEFADENEDYYLSKRERFELVSGLSDDREWLYEFCKPSVELIPEPENEHDPNAIRVEFNGKKAGYVPKEYCKKVKSMLSAEGCSVSAVIGGGPFRDMILHEDFDGDEERISDYDLIDDETPISAKIVITQTIAPAEVVCIYCGQPIRSDASFCTQCGKPISNE